MDGETGAGTECVTPGRRPYFVPSSIDFDGLPVEVKTAFVAIIQPTYLLVCRDSVGKQRAVYLGRSASLLAEVRRRLATLQGPLREASILDQAYRQLRAAVDQSWNTVDFRLSAFGLSRKGAEIRSRSSYDPANAATEAKKDLEG